MGIKGKDHKPYEYGNKVSIAATAKSNIIVGMVSPIHTTCMTARPYRKYSRTANKVVKVSVCDRGYRGPKTVGETYIILPAPPLKRDNRYQQDKKRTRCQRRAAIEPIIGHPKSDFRLVRNFLKGVTGDVINILMAAAWNFSLWMRLFFALMLGLKTPTRLNLLKKAKLQLFIKPLSNGVFRLKRP